jgi:hypothetical protein
VCLNQTRTKIGVLYGDPTTVPGGMAIPFHASVRIKLGAGQQILDKNKNPIGINVSAKTIKNKVAAPFRKCEFEIHFGVGIKEHEQLFDELRSHGEAEVNGKTICVGGNGAWKTFTVSDSVTGEVIKDKKFYKPAFIELLNDPEYAPYLDDLIELVYVKKLLTQSDISVDEESYEEVKAIADDLELSYDDGLDEIS